MYKHWIRYSTIVEQGRNIHYVCFLLLALSNHIDKTSLLVTAYHNQSYSLPVRVRKCRHNIHLNISSYMAQTSIELANKSPWYDEFDHELKFM